MDKKLVWLVTGAATGIGREIALAALDRGDWVIATTRARSFDALAPLKERGAAVVELDVTATLEVLVGIAASAIEVYGRVDVLVNNAGAYNAPGTLEDLTPEETIQQFNTNLLGPLNVTRAFLPFMREKQTGTVAWIGSLGGYSHVINAGLYSATKAAMIRISEALNIELKEFNVRSICFDVGYCRTDLLNPNRLPKLNQRIAAYKEISERWDASIRSVHQRQPGDPAKCAQVIVDIVRGEGVTAGKEIPSRFAIGTDAYDIIKEDGVKSLERLEEWKDVIRSIDIKDAELVPPKY